MLEYSSLLLQSGKSRFDPKLNIYHLAKNILSFDCLVFDESTFSFVTAMSPDIFSVPLCPLLMGFVFLFFYREEK